jgi:hypothetical protein
VATTNQTANNTVTVWEKRIQIFFMFLLWLIQLNAAHAVAEAVQMVDNSAIYQ